MNKNTLLLSGGLLLAASTALAQEAWQLQLQEQTRMKSGPGFADMASKGYSLVDVAKTNVLNAGTSELVNISVPVGSSYAIMGVCDNDCLDLDLTVLKEGIELSTDTTDDDWPVVQIMPTGETGYQIKVTMHQCSTTNCGYQLTVWKQ